MFNGYWLLFLGLIPNFIQLIRARYTANNLRFQAVSEAAQPVSRDDCLTFSLTFQVWCKANAELSLLEIC